MTVETITIEGRAGSSPNTLAERAKRGDTAAFGSLCKLYQRDMYAVSYCILHNNADCADAVQEALMKAYTRIGRLRRPEHFKTWLTRIVINECSRLAKKNGGRQAFAYIEQGAEDGDGELYRAIASLPDKQRLVLVLRYHQGYSVGEIAAMLGIPEGTVKSRAAAARNALRHMIEEE